MWKYLIAISLFVATTKSTLTDEQLIIKTPFGDLKGVEHEHYIAFEGIPYAEAPINDLRFEPPVAWTKKWDGIREANHPGKACLQWNHFEIDKDDKLTGSEDCLYLNIYIPKELPEEHVPVIAHIHGGALMFGKGDFYGPEYITKRPLIYVNFNYRLGPLGFLSTQCHLIPGNMGLKDQSLAMKWIKDNIALFKGNPEKITLTGFSAGGASVHLHHLSKACHGLFNNAIAHSGTALDPWVMQRKPVEKFIKVAEILGCGDKDTVHKDIVKCLKTKPAADIVRTVKEFQPFLYNPFQVFGVVVEADDAHHHHTKRSEHGHEHHGKTHDHHTKVFLTDTPLNLIKSHEGHHGNGLILTQTKDEGLYPAAEFIRKPEYLVYISEHWNDVAPYMLHYKDTIPADKYDEVSQKIRQHYMGDNTINEDNYKRFVDIFTDRLFHTGLDETVKLLGPKMPVYVYYYNFKLKFGIGEIFAGKTSNLLGVSHGDDVLLVYHIKDTEHILTEDEKKMQEKLLDLYVSFANTGEPKLGDFSMVKSEATDTVKFTKINAPDDIKTESYDNVGDHKFWDTIEFNEP
jgi:carboxylesterase type B